MDDPNEFEDHGIYSLDLERLWRMEAWARGLAAAAGFCGFPIAAAIARGWPAWWPIGTAIVAVTLLGAAIYVYWRSRVYIARGDVPWWRGWHRDA